MVLNYLILLFVFFNCNQAIIRIQRATGPPYLAHIVYGTPICFGSIICDNAIQTAKDYIPNNSDFLSKGKVLVGTRFDVEDKIKKIDYTQKDSKNDRMDRNNFDFTIITLQKALLMSKSVNTILLYTILNKIKSEKNMEHDSLVVERKNSKKIGSKLRSIRTQLESVQHRRKHDPIFDEVKAPENRTNDKKFYMEGNTTNENDKTGSTLRAPIVVDEKLFGVQNCCNYSIPELESEIKKSKITKRDVEEANTASEETNTAAEETNTANEETTLAPEETITATEETNTAAEETTIATEETITAPEDTTIATEETNTAKEETTLAPEETITANEETTTATEDETTATEETTTATEETTAVDEATVLQEQEHTTVADSEEPSSDLDNQIMTKYPTDIITQWFTKQPKITHPPHKVTKPKPKPKPGRPKGPGKRPKPKPGRPKGPGKRPKPKPGRPKGPGKRPKPKPGRPKGPGKRPKPKPGRPKPKPSRPKPKVPKLHKSIGKIKPKVPKLHKPIKKVIKKLPLFG